MLFVEVRGVVKRSNLDFELLAPTESTMGTNFCFSVSSCMSHFLHFFGIFQFLSLCTCVHCTAPKVHERPNREWQAAKVCPLDLFRIKRYSIFSGAATPKSAHLPLEKKKKKKRRKKLHRFMSGLESATSRNCSGSEHVWVSRLHEKCRNF